MPNRPTTPTPADITKLAKDAVYVTVGLGVIGFQRAQVRRQELLRRLAESRPTVEQQVSQARSQIAHAWLDLDDRVETAVTKMEDRFEPLAQRLPEQARNLVHQVRTQADSARTQVRGQFRGYLERVA